MLHQDGLGLPRGSRGVDQVGEVAGPGQPLGGEAALRRQVLVVDPCELRGMGWEGLDELRAGGDHRHSRIFQQVGEALPRRPRIEGQIGAPGLPDAEDAGHHRRVALGEQADDDLGSDAQPPQPMGQPVGPEVELRVGQPLAPGFQGHRARGRRRLGREPLDDRPGLPRRPGVVPFGHDLMARRRGQQRQLRKAPVIAIAGQNPPEQRLQGDDGTLQGRPVEQLGAVDEIQQEGVPRLPDAQLEIDPRAVLLELQGGQGKAGQLHGRRRHVLQREHHLEERVHRQGALRAQRFDELLEREVLMGVGLQGRAPGPRQQLVERRIAGQIPPQHQGIDEEADQRLDLRPVAVGDRRAHRHVLLPGEAAQERLEAGQEDHERGRLVAQGEAPQLARELRIPERGHPSAAMSRRGGARPVGRQIQGGRHAGEAVSPVAELPLQLVPGQPAALPDREIGVLDGQLRQGRGAARHGGSVERRDLPHEHPHRPAVGDDVVHGEQQDMLGRPQPQQRGAQEGPAFEIERPHGRLLGQPPRLGQADPRRQTGEVHPGEGPARRRRDHLRRFAVAQLEGGAQGFVAAHHLAEDRLQEGRRKLAASPQGGRHVVGRVARPQAVQEPEPLLGERERQRTVTGHRAERRSGGRRAGGRPGLLDPGRHAGESRSLEDGAQRQLDREGVAHPGDELGRQQRVPAQLEEAVLAADLLHPQNLPPKQGQIPFDGSARRRRGRGVAHRLRLRQRRAVHLAVTVERQVVEEHEGSRDHVLRQLAAQEPAQLQSQTARVLGGERIVGEGAPGEVRGLRHRGRSTGRNNGRRAPRPAQDGAKPEGIGRVDPQLDVVAVAVAERPESLGIDPGSRAASRSPGAARRWWRLPPRPRRGGRGPRPRWRAARWRDR